MKTDPNQARPEPAGDDTLRRNVDRVSKQDPGLFRKLVAFLGKPTVCLGDMLKRFTAAHLNAAAQELSRAQVFWNPQGPAIFGSIPHPRFVPEVVRVTEQFIQVANGAQFPLYVVETDLAVFAAQLAAVDMNAVFDSGRVMFFCGPEAWEELTAFFVANPWRSLPFSSDGRPIVTMVRPDETPKAQAFFTTAFSHRQKALNSALKDMTVHYPAPDNESRDKRLKTLFGQWFDGVQSLYQSGGVLNTMAETSDMLGAIEKQTGISVASPSRPQLPDKARILFMVSIFTTVLQHVVEDIAHALRRLGHETRVVKEPSAMDRLYPMAIVSALSEFKPHIVFQMDHLRREWPWVPRSVLHLTFIQDMVPALLSEQAGQSIGSNDFILVDTDFKWWQEMFDRYRYPRQNFIHFPSCTNEETFKPTELSESDRAKFGSDIAVTTNIDLRPAQAWENAVAENLRGFSHTRLREAMVYDMFQTVANAFYRLTPLEWLIPLGLNMKIWGKFPQDTHPSLGKYFVGPAQFEDLPKIYQASKITLLGNHAGWRHYKTASVLASGGLPLVRFHPDSCEDIVDEETMMFRGPDDLREKVRYWLSHEEERLNAVRKWRTKVLAERTYVVQMARAFEQLRISDFGFRMFGNGSKLGGVAESPPSPPSEGRGVGR